jgi:plastocyanin
MRKLLALSVSIAVLGAVAATALAATKSVKVGDNYYVRSKGVPTVTVNKNDRLKFNFTGANPHNAVSKSISLGSKCKKARASGSCLSNRLRRTGTFRIYCSVHGAKDQSMKVRVR